MVKMGQEVLVVAALLISVKSSRKLKIYYINRVLSKLNCYALYIFISFSILVKEVFGKNQKYKHLKHATFY